MKVQHYLTKEAYEKLGHLIDRDLTEGDVGEIEEVINKLIKEAPFPIYKPMNPIQMMMGGEGIKSIKINYGLSEETGHVIKESANITFNT